MGFLGSLFSTPKVNVPASGLYAQPKAFQGLYSGLLGAANSSYLPNGALNSTAFTPLAQTADETNAFNQMRTGFAPTAQSLQSDISMQMNPYDSFVMDEINRQAGGQYSLLKQGMTDAGQFGSNRMMLGANDIDLSRLNQIGAFKQQGYGQAMNNAMTTLPALRSADAQGLLGIGDFQRNLQMQTNQAPFQALQSGMGLLGGFGQMGQGTPQTTVKSGGGGFFGNLLKTVAPMALGWAGAGLGLTGGFDPTSGITWNSGRV